MPKLWKYQEAGVNFLAARKRAGLADEPSLGKSVQALLAVRRQARGGRVLVVAPGNAIGVWQDEIAAWLREGSSVFAGARPDPEILHHSGFVITTYKRLEQALPLPWAAIIFDEAQALRNRNTRTLFRTVKRLLKTEIVYFLSGTPLVKNAGDLWPILHLIDRKAYGSYWRFVHRYAIVEQGFGNHWKVEGVANPGKLWKELNVHVLRRLKADVAPELPRKVRQSIPLYMTPKQRSLYKSIVEDMYYEDQEGTLKLVPGKLAVVTRLRQALVCPRILGVADDGAAIAAMEEELELNPRRIVVFTPFAEAIPFIADHTNVETFILQGGMTPRAIDRAVKAFTAWQHPGVLLSTMGMGTSWSAHRATSEVYFNGFGWNATDCIQCEDRVHRRGQNDTVFARYYQHRGTVDRHQMKVVAGKAKWARILLDRPNVLRDDYTKP